MDLVRFQGKITTGNDGFQVKIHYFAQFWPAQIIPRHSRPEKISPLVEKIFVHEISLGNDIPWKLSKSGVPTPSER